jgi:hypothetical protein
MASRLAHQEDRVAGDATGIAWLTAVVPLVGTLLLGACAALDEHAVAETYRLGDAPYYVELSQPQPARGTCAIVFPVAIDPGVVDSFGYAGLEPGLQALLAALNARIGARHGCVEAVVPGPTGRGAPRVYVGVADSEYAPPEAAVQRMPQDRFAPMVLHVERPDDGWRRDAAALIARAGTEYAISIQLGVSQYGKGYSGPFRKEVALGTGYRQPIKFLTAEDKPVEVLHLTGVLVDATGKPVRAGAEGIVLRDTPFLAQAVDATRVFSDAELQRVLTSDRRNDLPGAPLDIDVALDNLVAQLTRSEVRVPAQ